MADNQTRPASTGKEAEWELPPLTPTKQKRGKRLPTRQEEDRPTFRSPYAFQGPDTSVPIPSWLFEGSSDGMADGRDSERPNSVQSGLRSVTSLGSLGLRSASTSQLNFRPEASSRGGSCPPKARWWLQEPKTGMQSLGKGLFEIFTGVSILRTSPTPEAETIGSLCSGTRFYAKPRQISGSTWLEVQTRGAPPPIWSLASAESLGVHMKVAEQDDGHISHKLYKASGRSPLVKPDFVNGGAWIEYNKQYIHRIRDIGRERGAVNYSCMNRQIHTTKPGIKDWLRRRMNPDDESDESVPSTPPPLAMLK